MRRSSVHDQRWSTAATGAQSARSAVVESAVDGERAHDAVAERASGLSTPEWGRQAAALSARRAPFAPGSDSGSYTGDRSAKQVSTGFVPGRDVAGRDARTRVLRRLLRRRRPRSGVTADAVKTNWPRPPRKASDLARTSPARALAPSVVRWRIATGALLLTCSICRGLRSESERKGEHLRARSRLRSVESCERASSEPSDVGLRSSRPAQLACSAPAIGRSGGPLELAAHGGRWSSSTAEDHLARGCDQARSAGRAVVLGNLDAKRDWGYASRLRRGDVADAPARPPRRLRDRRPARPTPVRRCVRGRLRQGRDSTGRSARADRRRLKRRPRSTCWSATPSKAERELGWKLATSVRAADSGSDGRVDAARTLKGRYWGSEPPLPCRELPSR